MVLCKCSLKIILTSLYLVEGLVWWDWPLTWCTDQLLSFSAWHCWLGHLTCKNRPRYDLYCVWWDVKPYSTLLLLHSIYWLLTWPCSYCNASDTWSDWNINQLRMHAVGRLWPDLPMWFKALRLVNELSRHRWPPDWVSYWQWGVRRTAATNVIRPLSPLGVGFIVLSFLLTLHTITLSLHICGVLILKVFSSEAESQWLRMLMHFITWVMFIRVKNDIVYAALHSISFYCTAAQSNSTVCVSLVYTDLYTVSV